jgi:hypothetical protein
MTTFPVAEREATDASGFLDKVDLVVAGPVFRYAPQLVCLVRIHKWFDHGWLGFSGKGRVFFDPPWPSHAGVSLDEFHQEQLTFPPFAPSRVTSERHWVRQSDGRYALGEAPFRVHSSERRRSSSNLQRRIVELTDSGLFVWFSSSSLSDTRGSILVYSVHAGSTIPWFASIRRDTNSVSEFVPAIVPSSHPKQTTRRIVGEHIACNDRRVSQSKRQIRKRCVRKVLQVAVEQPLKLSEHADGAPIVGSRVRHLRHRSTLVLDHAGSYPVDREYVAKSARKAFWKCSQLAPRDNDRQQCLPRDSENELATLRSQQGGVPVAKSIRRGTMVDPRGDGELVEQLRSAAENDQSGRPPARC